jgi:predicted methyltransferase
MIRLGSLWFSFLLACGGSAAPATSPDSPGETGGERRAQEGGGHGCGHGEHRFEDADRWAELFDHPERDAWQKPDEVVALLELEPAMTAVDVGAGTGYFLARLSGAVGPGGRVIATDIEPDMVRYMKERAEREKLANVEAVLAPTDDVGVAPGTADRILFVDVWHHIGDRERYAAKLARALRPGGAVLIIDFTLESKRGPPPAHRLAPDKVIAELAAGGLSAELVPESLPDQYAVRARRR